MDTATKRITAISVSQPWRMVVAVPSVGSTRAERLSYVYRYASEAEAVPAGFVCLRDLAMVRGGAAIVMSSGGATLTMVRC